MAVDPQINFFPYIKSPSNRDKYLPSIGNLILRNQQTGENKDTGIVVKLVLGSHDLVAALTQQNDVIIVNGQTDQQVVLLKGSDLGPKEQVERLLFSPNGEMISFNIQDLATFTSKIVLARVDGSSQRYFISKDQNSHDLSFIKDIAWSPSGKKIAFSSLGDGIGNPTDIFYGSVSDGKNLLDAPKFLKSKLEPYERRNLRWSADGTKLLYEQMESSDSTNYFTVKMTPDGSELRQIEPSCMI